MIRSKPSTKVVFLATGIALSVAAFAGSQPAVAQSYSCPGGTAYDPTYGCTLSSNIYEPYDYGYYGPYRGVHREFSHGFAHGMGSANHGIGFVHAGGFERGVAGGLGHANRGVGFAHFGGGGFGHSVGGGFGHGGGGGHR